MAASSSLDKESRNAQVHMKSEHMESTSYDPVTLAGYGYLVCEKIDDSTSKTGLEITVDRIWSCDVGPPLGTSDGKLLKEIDVWTEMVLYIAPSDNAKSHIEHLANGGEFLTHLWALLLHAGILKREQRSFDEQNTVTSEVQPHLPS
ncbi:hypothetical protein C2845_PM04G00260 [Panicum miliaceum]|uniref:Uncharacterized protein n=1 Tax=Panicum miliaceum TaxID=4540 RepID=A0A3L6QU71_PANMI|nr:hypothetical protein C2845_PM04G00260 [Panicum miliaceum]